MAEILPSRQVTQQEDTAYRRAVSENILSKVGAQNNFVNKFQTDIKEFKLNGSYRVAAGLPYYDGAASFFYNSQIVGISFFNGTSGSAGTTEFDLRWINTAGVDQGSIFSTTPKINSSSNNGAVGFINYTTGTTVTPTGVTLPVLAKSTFLEGETIYMVLNDAMLEANNCSINMFYLPIN